MLFSKNKIFSLTLVAFMGAFLPDLACASKNKESFPPLAAIFSPEKDIDYPRLQAHLHHEFKDLNLLRDALYPMLPKTLQGKENDFDLLEWQGDAVLELVMTDRLIEIFPGHHRGHLDQLCSHLVKNKTLTEIYLWNLDLERYLPLPDEPYEICNVVEALVGAIYKDDRRNGLDNARRFVMRLLDEETTQVEIPKFIAEQQMRTNAPKKPLTFTQSVSPEQEEAVKTVCTPARFFKESSKSLLNEVLLKIFDERPEYVTHFDMDEKGQVVFVSHVVAAQVGKKNEGRGRTQQQAEENAARQALMSLSRGALSPSEALPDMEGNFRYQLSEVLKFLALKDCVNTCETVVAPFKCQIYLDGKVIGEGEGASKAQAKEAAARQALTHLMPGALAGSDKNFRSQLQERMVAQKKTCTDAYQEGVTSFKVKIMLGGKNIGAGEGASKAQAEEAAAKEACAFIIDAEKSKRDAREALRLGQLQNIRKAAGAKRTSLVVAAPASVAASASSMAAFAPAVPISTPVGAVTAPAALKPAVAASTPSGAKQQPRVANTKANGRGAQDHKKQNPKKAVAPAKVAVPKAGLPKSVPTHKQNENTKPR